MRVQRTHTPALRRAAVPMALLIAAAIQGQTKTAQGDAAVLQALQNLRQKTAISLQMTGQVEIGVKPLVQTESIACTAYWSETQSKPLNGVQSEVLEYKGNRLTNRLVADGASVWNYNLLAHEYHAGAYTSYQHPLNTPQNRDVDSALEMLRLDASHVGAYATRLLEQTYGGTAPTFQSWIPRAAVQTVPDPKVQDMIDVIYTLGSPLRRQATFKLISSDNTLQLAEIDFTDVSTNEGRQRTVTWMITPGTLEPKEANFKPYPGNNVSDWKVVSNSG